MIPPDRSAIWDEPVEEQNKEAIARELFRLTIWLVGNAPRRSMDGELIRWFHQQAFGRFFPLAAGRVRGTDFPLNVDFGKFLGAPFEECEAAFDQLCTDAIRWTVGLDSLAGTRRGESVVQVACHHHARFIKIHPFVDGNGRTSRLCVNYFAARYGLNLISVQRTSDDDYIEALKAYVLYDKVAPLVDLWRPGMLGANGP